MAFSATQISDAPLWSCLSVIVNVVDVCSSPLLTIEMKCNEKEERKRLEDWENWLNPNLNKNRFHGIKLNSIVNPIINFLHYFLLFQFAWWLKIKWSTID